MAQTFFPITPTEFVPGGEDDWYILDVSASVPAGATGVILHVVDTGSAKELGLRKNGSTDDRHRDMHGDGHFWAMIGVAEIEGVRSFEAYVESTTNVDIYVVGYTKAGVTFNTNADDMSLAGIGDGSPIWQSIDCSTEAPSATGLIFEIQSTSLYEFGFRKNGSNDDRHFDTDDHRCFGAIIGCDASQLCDGYIENTNVDFFLVGYVTDGATFNTNATDVSLGTTDKWLDLSALPAGANMGFIEVAASPSNDYGLRKNGSGEDIYLAAYKHPWAIVECASLIIEGKIESTDVDFFVVGYSEELIIYYQNTGQGAITPTGTLSTIRKIFQSVGAGAITPVGDLVASLLELFYQNVGQGAIVAVGILGRKIKLTVGSGSITPSGALSAIKQFIQSVGAGAITPVGALGRKILLAVGGGAITPTGALSTVKRFIQSVGSGAITPAATLGRKILIAVGSGAITPTGALSTIKRFIQSVGSGAITPVGALGRVIKLVVGSGAITPSGVLNRLIKIAVGAGAITPTGALNRLIKIAVGAGSIIPTGALSTIKKIFQSVGSGAITPIGTLGRLIKIGVGAGAITPAGTLNRLIKIAVGAGSITPTGALGRLIKLVVGSGVIAPIGALNRLIKITVGQGAITPVGILATFWEWIVLTLRPKSLLLTLQYKTLALTLKVKSLALTLLKRG